MKYRLGLDVGVGSLGWAITELDEDGKPFRVERAGSRIYGTGRHPKDKTTRASERTSARAARRTRDRYKQRRDNTLRTLIDAGLFPANPEKQEKLKSLNPWRLRYEGIRGELNPFEVGRAIYHLQQRRGFLSNRKADRAIDDKSAMLSAINTFKAQVGETETVGSYLHQQILGGKTGRARHRGTGAKAEYDFYVDRSMIEDEFNRIWETQAAFHPSMTPEHKKLVYNAIFWQRPLKPKTPGTCFLEQTETRSPKALASSQLFRLFQEVNALRVVELDRSTRPLTLFERDKAIDYLKGRKDAQYTQLRTRLFGRDHLVTFSHENGQRTRIPGDVVANQFQMKKAFGHKWFDLDLPERDQIVEEILGLETEESIDDLTADFETRYELSHEAATNVVNAKLPDGHFRLSQKAIGNVLPHLQGWNEDQDRPHTYDSAVLAAGYENHSARPPGEGLATLPYYGVILQRYTADLSEQALEGADQNEAHWGRIGNPTVHIGLNQIRRVVNKLIDIYGPPAQIHVEVARDLSHNREDRARISKSRREGEERNNKIREELAELGISDNYDNRLKLRLFDELAGTPKKCVFSGKVIEKAKLFTAEYQIDHILPYSRTLDDGFNNKALVHHTANQYKGNRTPFEAFADSEDGYEWGPILDRSQDLRHGKRWRFSQEAMDVNANGDTFLARHLNDTRYLARVTKQYLEVLVPTDHSNAVIAVPGCLTAELRHQWGLNSILSKEPLKNRSDHRHHAVDAVTISLTDRGSVQRMTRAAKFARLGFGDRKLEDFEPP